MIDCADLPFDEDPRHDESLVRCLPGTDGRGAVLLVGVVHDHPASVARTVGLLEGRRPDYLAVELPPLAVGLFELYARDPYTPPRLGGEMSAAIQAAGDAAVVGVDAPSGPYLRRLAGRLLRERQSGPVLGTVLRDVATGIRQAVACRLASALGAVTPFRPKVYDHIEYDCTLLDSPAAQAADEASHLSQRRAFLGAVETPPAIRVIDETREATMTERIGDLRTSGDVVAVVGAEHLDPLAAALAA